MSPQTERQKDTTTRTDSVGNFVSVFCKQFKWNFRAMNHFTTRYIEIRNVWLTSNKGIIVSTIYAKECINMHDEIEDGIYAKIFSAWNNMSLLWILNRDNWLCTGLEGVNIERIYRRRNGGKFLPSEETRNGSRTRSSAFHGETRSQVSYHKLRTSYLPSYLLSFNELVFILLIYYLSRRIENSIICEQLYTD